MKFVCNNCGFSAEVPDRRTTCPMCASDNVSVVSMTEQIPSEKPEETKESEKPGTENISGGVTPQKDEPVEKKKRGPTERITLNDEFFDSKPDKEQQEIANILKELYPESGEVKKASFKMPDKKILAAAAVVAAVIVLAFVLAVTFTGDPDDDNNETVIAAGQDQNENENEVVTEPEDLMDDEDLKPIHEVAKKVEEEDDPDIEEDNLESEPETVKKTDKQVQTVKKAPVKPKKIKVVKTAPRKIVKKVSTAPKLKFQDYIKAGHKALAEKRFTDALHEYKNASRLNPSNGSVYKFLGITYAYLQNQNQACTNYRKYIKFSPNAPDKAQVEAFLKACP
jgi:tetratricopeptide (TPR) repeat protein